MALLTIVVTVVDRDRQYRSLLAEGDRALAGGNAVSAIAAYSGALGLRPTSVAAHIRRGQAYRDQRRNDEAVKDWSEAARLAPRSTQPLELLGDLHASLGNDTQAAAAYERSVQLDPADASRQYKLGLARYRAGSPATAIEPLKRAVDLNDNFGEAHYLLGIVLRDTQSAPLAMASLERAIRVAPTLSAAREELADLYRAAGRPVDELAQLQSLASLDPQTPRSVALAVAEARNGQFDGAIATLTDAAAQDPNDSQIHLGLGRVYLERAERTLDRRSSVQAITALQRALPSTPRRSEALTMLGRAQFLSGDPASAQRTLEQAIAIVPVTIEAYGYIADACERLGKYQDARDALRKLDALEGDTAPSAARSARARRLGSLSLKAGDSPTAITYLKRVIQEGQRDSGTLGELADAQSRAGQMDEARKTLADALARDPNNAELQRLKRQIR